MTQKSDSIQVQCWICPKCHDDHRQDGPCTPRRNVPFMPAPEDQSYIAQEYRKVMTALNLAAGYISATPGWTDRHPMDAYDWLIAEAERVLK